MAHTISNPSYANSASSRRRRISAGAPQVKSLAEYEALYRQRREDPEGILGRARARIDVVQALQPSAGMEVAVCQMVSRRRAERLLQLSRPPSDGAAPQQGRADLGGRAGRLARADLPDARRRGWRAAPTRSRALGSRMATGSRSTCRWCPRR